MFFAKKYFKGSVQPLILKSLLFGPIERYHHLLTVAYKEAQFHPLLPIKGAVPFNNFKTIRLLKQNLNLSPKSSKSIHLATWVEIIQNQYTLHSFYPVPFPDYLLSCLSASFRIRTVNTKTSVRSSRPITHNL